VSNKLKYLCIKKKNHLFIFNEKQKIYAKPHKIHPHQLKVRIVAQEYITINFRYKLLGDLTMLRKRKKIFY